MTGFILLVAFLLGLREAYYRLRRLDAEGEDGPADRVSTARLRRLAAEGSGER